MNESSKLNEFNYFLKGDISGIQEFIFNVKSEKAARVLKARSLFVQTLTLFAKLYVEENFEKDKVNEFYFGGGSFFLEVSDERTEIEIRKVLREIEGKINSEIFKEDVYVALSVVPANGAKDFKNYWTKVSTRSNQDKLQRYTTCPEAFESYIYETEIDDKISENDNLVNWLDFAHWLPKRGADMGENFIKTYTVEIQKKAFVLLNRHIQLKKNPSKDFFESKIHNKLPIWRRNLYIAYEQEILKELANREATKVDNKEKNVIKMGHIIDYHFLARFAEKRTGTKKIGILKLDIDNLGNLFRFMPDRDTAKTVSKGLITPFFETKINDFLNYKLGTQIALSEEELNQSGEPITYRDNIYTIFSGGDDCIFIGGWDAILEWADLLETEFQEIGKAIKDLVIDKVDDDVLSLPPTISAGVAIVEPTFPVVQLSKLVEKSIDQAKYYTYFKGEKPTKSKISIFGKCLTWEEFRDSKRVAKILENLVCNQQEPRTIIERIKQSAKAFEEIQEKAFIGEEYNFGVSKLFYFVRHSKNQKMITKELIRPYANDLIKAFTQKKRKNPLKYPVAARWAEFLTRNKDA